MKYTLSLSPLSLAVFGLFVSLSGLAVAQTSTALDTIVVSGSRSATKLSETPVSIGSVSRAQWDADKPKSVGEIINRIPGVHWNDLGNDAFTVVSGRCRHIAIWLSLSILVHVGSWNSAFADQHFQGVQHDERHSKRSRTRT